MILNPIGLMQESATLSRIATVPTQSLKEAPHSFFIETLQFLSEMNVDFYEAKRSFYISLSESTDIVVVHESFGDFFDKVKEIINKFLAFIKSLFDRFVTMLNKLIGRDKYILNHKSEFEKFSRIHEFTITGFNYTIVENIPVINAKASFSNDFVFNFGDEHTVTFSGSKATAIDNIKSSTAALSDALSDGVWYDKFRAEVIGKDGVIAKDDFADSLFSEYRNGEPIAEEITIDGTEVRAALRRFETAKSDIEKVKRLKAKIDSEYNSIKRQVEKMVITNREGSSTIAKFDSQLDTKNFSVTSSDDIVAMDNFVKAKVNQLQEMSNIHALAFAAKLDALRDCYRQDKTVLFKALSRVQSNKKED